MRYAADMQRIALELTINKDWCVLQCVYDVGTLLSPADMEKLKAAHFKRIEVSDAIYVVNIDGYIGNSTQKEIDYAKSHNKEIIYHQQ